MDKEPTEQVLEVPMFEAWSPGDVLYFGPSSRSIAVFGQIGTELVLPAISQILELDGRDSKEAIRVHINTEGGSLSDGFAMYDALRSVQAPIVTITTGLCASAGLLILAAGDLKLATESTVFFYHQAILPSEGFQSIAQLDATAEGYQIAQQSYDNIIITRNKIKKTIWKKEFEGKTAKYFNAEQALEYGIIDGIIPNNKKKKVPGV